jgi:hypothetical protein
MELVRLNKMCLNESYVKVCKGKYLLQFSYRPAIATEMFFILLQSFTTTCFGPYGPSSGGIQHQLSFYGAISATTDPLFCDCLDMWCEHYTYFTVFTI